MAAALISFEKEGHVISCTNVGIYCSNIEKCFYMKVCEMSIYQKMTERQNQVFGHILRRG